MCPTVSGSVAGCEIWQASPSACLHPTTGHLLQHALKQHGPLGPVAVITDVQFATMHVQFVCVCVHRHVCERESECVREANVCISVRQKNDLCNEKVSVREKVWMCVCVHSLRELEEKLLYILLCAFCCIIMREHICESNASISKL